MKPKYIFAIMTLVVFLLLTTIVLNLSHPDAEEKNEEHYSKETITIINGEEYSKTFEEFIIVEEDVTYKKRITYTNNNEINYEETSTIDFDKFIMNNKTYYIIDKKVCEEKSCNSFYAPYNETETHKIELNLKDVLISTNSIKKHWNNEITIFYIHDTNYKDLSNIVKDYDINIYTLYKNTLSKRLKEELIEYDNTILIYQKEELIATISPDKLHETLFHLGIKSR